MSSANAEIGVTGLAVMGRNLARNFARNGFVDGRAQPADAKTDGLIDEHGARGRVRAVGVARRISSRR